jgi:hypothetical protein
MYGVQSNKISVQAVESPALEGTNPWEGVTFSTFPNPFSEYIGCKMQMRYTLKELCSIHIVIFRICQIKIRQR